MKTRSNKGFSLVEITISIGIVAFAMLAIVGLIPVGMNSARDAGDDTRTSMIAQDAYNRIRARMNSNDSSKTDRYFSAYNASTTPASSQVATYFFYTNEGIFNPNNNSDGYLNKVTATSDKPSYYASNYTNGSLTSSNNFYRAKVVVSTIDPAAQASYPSYDPRAGSDFLCATVEIGWPVYPNDGSIVGTANAAKATYVFYLRKP